ncbi:MAG: AzlD domain-containing protein [Geovibrio sp.]|nr:AzlD domain-containing protein [Geovibrio sp.]MCD8567201.1 AzlD domain-containing protein [Geovibrio sp.]
MSKLNIIILMALVTYIPRMLPMVFLKNMHLAPWLNRFLRFIPYASLGALIFPGALFSVNPPIAAAGGIAVSAALAFLGRSLIAVFASGVAAVYILLILL